MSSCETARSMSSRESLATLFNARGADFRRVCEAADALRAETNGAVATYVVNRNINYTNICGYRCTFCAFSKGTRKHEGAERAYLLDVAEIVRRSLEARERGATEVCLQGGIHPSFTGETYLDILRGGEVGRSGDARARILAARGLARRDHARHEPARLLVAAARRGTRQSSRDGGGDSGRPRARRAVSRQAEHGSVARSDRDGARDRSADHVDHDVRSRRRLRRLGGSPRQAPGSAKAHAWIHRVRAAAVRGARGAAVQARPGEARTDACASRCSCTRWRVSRCTRISTTFRPPG